MDVGPDDTEGLLYTASKIRTPVSAAAEAGSFNGGTLAANGMIYCVPYNASSVMKIDPVTQKAASTGSYLHYCHSTDLYPYKKHIPLYVQL